MMILGNDSWFNEKKMVTCTIVIVEHWKSYDPECSGTFGNKY